LTQWEGPSLEGYVGFLLLLSGLAIVGYYVYGNLGSTIAFLGTLIAYVVVGEFVWKNHPRLAWRKSWPAYWSQLWRMFPIGLGVLALLILIELLVGTAEIIGVRYDFIFGVVLVALGTILEITGRKKPPLGLNSQPNISQ